MGLGEQTWGKEKEMSHKLDTQWIRGQCGISGTLMPPAQGEYPALTQN